MALYPSFIQTQRLAKTHSWSLYLHDPVHLPLQQLAAALADRIVRVRCQPSPVYRAWQSRAAGGAPHLPTTHRALEAFLGPAVGLPDLPIPDDHLEGMVAEYLWYVLTVDGGANDSVFRVIPPGFLATSPGGDGLVIHRDDATAYSFRLWELKKCTGKSVTVGATVTKAFTQLEAKGARYLGTVHVDRAGNRRC
jgi:hypothetical protein